MCVYKKIMKKKYSTIDVEMYEIVKIQMHFWSNYLIFLF